MQTCANHRYSFYDADGKLTTEPGFVRSAHLSGKQVDEETYAWFLKPAALVKGAPVCHMCTMLEGRDHLKGPVFHTAVSCRLTEEKKRVARLRANPHPREQAAAHSTDSEDNSSESKAESDDSSSHHATSTSGDESSGSDSGPEVISSSQAVCAKCGKPYRNTAQGRGSHKAACNPAATRGGKARGRR
jgi:hypothetical protein